MNRATQHSVFNAALVLLLSVLLAPPVMAVDVISNGNFSSGTTGWTHTDITGTTAMSSDGSYGNPSPSLKGLSGTGKKTPFEWYDYQNISTTINSTDDVFLSLWWQKISFASIAQDATDIEVRIVKPSSAEVTIWSDNSTPGAPGTPITGVVSSLNVSSFFDEDGLYEIRLYANVQTGNNNNGQIQVNWDNVILDAQPVVANQPPVVTNIPNQSVPEGSSFTTITLDDYVSDPTNTDAEMTWSYSGNTELTVDISSRVATITIPDINWNGAETITFRATDPGSLWDEDPATFTVTAVNDPPVVSAGATSVSPASVNRIGANTTVISTSFSDVDVPGVGAFNVTFKIREPNNSTELTLVNAQPNGGGGLTITDQGSGNYTASYTYNPDDAQTTGLYDLYMEVTDGADNAIDNYTEGDNADELTITTPNLAPTVALGVTSVSVSPINRLGASTTTISTAFTDADVPGVGAFNVTFKIREPNNSTELTLVNAQPNGGGGLTISDDGGGNYTASYTYNPDDAQTLGPYDLYFYVSDGVDNVTDPYTSNVDELTIGEAPVMSFGATSASPIWVVRTGTNTTTISADFTDADDPGVGAFTVTISVRWPNNSTTEVLVDNQVHGVGGLTITDNGGGSYTAEVTWDPTNSQPLGFYDLYCQVSDNVGSATDNYDEADELEVVTSPPANPPTVSTGATVAAPASVNRIGTNTTTISTVFTDVDQPGVGAFTVTFKVKDIGEAETVLVNAQTNGNGGLTITDGGGGSYTASYTWDPGDAQNTGTYDLYFEADDGTGSAIDAYADNGDELTITSVAANNAPTVAAGATAVSPTSVNRLDAATTTISTSFSDADAPGVGAFNVTFKIREPNNSTELTLVNLQPNGGGGLTITDDGGGDYTASYTYNPDDAQTLGFYDLYFYVSDGTDNVTDDYTDGDNSNELEITEPPNNVPTVTPGATVVSVSPVNRLGISTTIISTNFSDADIPGVGAFNVTFKIREKNNITELTLVDNQPNGGGGLSISDLGSGNYMASYIYDPSDVQDTGLYDLYFEVSDGSDNVIDSYASNDNELEIVEVIANATPTITAGNTSVNPSSLDRLGAVTTQFSVTFDDTDEPGIDGFWVTFMVQSPYSEFHQTVADSLMHGVGGMSIVDNGGGSYTATFDWDPADNQMLGYYDLRCEVADAYIEGTDSYISNTDELLITNGGENIPPVVPGDAVFATPAGVERIGANPTTLSATFVDGDVPGVNAFDVTFKLRHPNDITETVLADNVGNGAGGVTINDDGGGIYTASISWDPGDAQSLGYYDLYFHVTDGADTTYDVFQNNLDELQLYDAISNNTPTLTAGATFPLPTSVNRIGVGYTMLKSTFADIDEPGLGAFTITFKTRDLASGEVTVVNAAKHGEQGLRVVSLGGGNYEAAVLWDPNVAEPIGGHDLYFSVTDNNNATAIDNYTSNTDELNVTSATILGDGHLLRRNNDSTTCGGPNNACHNLPGHQDQDCRVCHTPHGTSNIYLVRETIATPNSGDREVIFKTLGIGDPYNDPDPVKGDPNSGVMADSTDDVYTGVCEVCHTSTGHHRNDGSQPPPNHNDAMDCTSCHPHSESFAVSGGGESGGGSNCSCHGSTFNPMNTSTTSYHHQINSDAADYASSARTCLMCHVDHDIFRPDLNTGFGARSKNLRSAYNNTPVQGDNSVMLNSDYQSTGAGGICLSCHTSAQTKTNNPPDGSTGTVAISKTDFDAATGTHNYTVPSTFATDASTFNANCVKCHNDTMTKSYQSSTNKFGAHDSPYGRILNPFGTSSPSDPLEENVCFACHSTTSNPNAGSNQDYFGVKAMSSTALRVENAMNLTYGHPTTTFSGRHKSDEVAADFADGNRHAECGDCHSVHGAQQGTHDGSTSLASNALKGTWGVKPTSWPAAPTPSDNANVFAAPVSFTKVEDATLEEWMICMKCHSNYTTLPSGKRNLAEEINPNYPSTHGITIANTNSYCNTTTMNEPWGSTGRTWCSDCHRSDNAADPEGPHGSNSEHLLVATIVSNSTVGTPLCDVCHKASVYWDGSASASKYQDHPATQGQHLKAPGCFSCHMLDHASTAGLGLPTTDWTGGFDNGASESPYLKIWIHGQNRKWVYNEQDGSAGSQQPVDNFINGYIADMDHSANRCWTETCKVHSNKAY